MALMAPRRRFHVETPLLWIMCDTRLAAGRIDNVQGDRNLVCTCAGMEGYSAS
jgi:hypothetical protein